MAIKSLKSNSYGRSVMAGNSLILPGDYESIATVSLASGNTGYLVFNSIPQTFKHLQIRALTRDNAGFAQCNMYLQFNTEYTGGNYGWHRLAGDGASVSVSQFTATSQIWIGNGGGNGAAANIFGIAVIDVLDYADTNKYKTARGLSGMDRNGSGYIGLHSGYWASTSAITSLRLSSDNGVWGGFTHIGLYGIRG